MTRQDLIQARESLQHDLTVDLDGADDRLVNDVCQRVVEVFAGLLTKWDAAHPSPLDLLEPDVCPECGDGEYKPTDSCKLCNEALNKARDNDDSIPF